MLIKVTIEGTKPLLCNRFTDESAMKATKRTGTSAVGERGTPREQASKKLYMSEDTGKPMIPGPNVFRSIIDAGKFFKSGKSKVTTQKSSLIPACLELDEIEVPIKHKEPWMVDERAVRNPSTGGRFICYRPKFQDWELSFTLTLDEEMMTAQLLREIVDAAGKKIGLGDFRPDCKGPFGKFVVKNWDRVNGS